MGEYEDMEARLDALSNRGQTSEIDETSLTARLNEISKRKTAGGNLTEPSVDAYAIHSMQKLTQKFYSYDDIQKDKTIARWSMLPQVIRNKEWNDVLGEVLTSVDMEHQTLIASLRSKFQNTQASVETEAVRDESGTVLVPSKVTSKAVPKISKEEAVFLADHPAIKQLIKKDQIIKKMKKVRESSFNNDPTTILFTAEELASFDSEEAVPLVQSLLYESLLSNHVSELITKGVDPKTISEDGSIDPTAAYENTPTKTKNVLPGTKEYGPNWSTQGAFEPEVTAAFLASSGLVAARTALAAGEAVLPTVTRLMLTEVPIQVATDIVASYAEDKSVLFQLFGPMGAAALLSATANGVKTMGAALRASKRTDYDAIMKIQADKGTVVQLLQETFKEYDAGKLQVRGDGIAGLQDSLVSKVIAKLEDKKTKIPEDDARRYANDAMKIIKDAVERPETPMGQVAKRAIGVNSEVDFQKLITLGLDPTIDMRVLGGYAREDLPQLLVMQDSYTKSMLLPLADIAASEKLTDIRGKLLKFVSDNGTDYGYGADTFRTNYNMQSPFATLKKWIASPQFTVDNIAPGLREHMTNLNLKTNKHIKYLNESIDGLYKGLSGDELKELDGIVYRGAQERKSYSVVDGMLVDDNMKPLTGNSKIIEAYQGYRMIYDHLWATLNKTVNDNLSRGGVRQIKGKNNIFKKVHAPQEGLASSDGKFFWNDGMKKVGYEAWEEVDADEKLGKQILIVTGDEATNMFRDVSPTRESAPYFTGYATRSYTDPWFTTTTWKNPATGKREIKDIKTASTYADAQNYEAQFQAGLVRDDMTEEELQALANMDYTVITSKKDSRAGGIFTSLDAKSRAMLGKLSDEDLLDLRAQLQRSGLSESEAYSLTAVDDIARPKGVRNLRSRNLNILKNVNGQDASVKNIRESLLDYSSSIMRHSDRVAITNAFEEAIEVAYKDVVIRDKNSKTLRVATASEMAGMASDDTAKVVGEKALAKLEQRQLQAAELLKLHDFFLGQKTGFELREMEVIESKARAFFQSDLYRDISSKYPKLDKLVITPALTKASISGVVRGTKAIFYHAKLGFLGIATGAIQAFPQLLNMGVKLANPKYGPAAVSRGISIMFDVIMEGRTPGWFTDGKSLEIAKYNKEILEKSGFTSSTNFKRSDEIYEGRVGKFASAQAASTKFFSAGEGFSRGAIFFVERDEMIQEILDKGFVVSNNKVYKKADIDGAHFLDEVSTRATKLAFDFSAINRPHLLRAGGEILSVPFMLQQYSMKQFELMVLNGELTWPERMGLWATWGAAFGLAGIPLASDSISIAETLYALKEKDAAAYGDVKRTLADEILKPVVDKFNKNPEVFDATERAVMKGMISSLSNGYIDVAHRATLDKLLTSYFDNKTPEEIIGGPMLTSYVDMIGELGKLAAGGEFTFWEGVKLISEQETRVTGLSKLRQSAAVGFVSTFNSLVKAAEMAETGEIKTKSGYVVSRDVDMAHILLQAAGFTPSSSLEAGEEARILTKQMRLMKKWEQDVTNQFTQLLAAGAQKTAQEYLMAVVKRADETGNVAAKMAALSVIKSASSRVMSMRATADERIMMQIIKDPSKALILKPHIKGR